MSPTTSLAERSCRVVRQPQGIDDARRFAELSVTLCSDDCREAATMVVTELAENMIKYSDRNGTFAGTIAIAVEDDQLRISATNSVGTPKDAERVSTAVAQISAAKDVKALYRARLETLFHNRGLEKAQLGLLRAAYEGGFRLSCRYQAATLTVVAVRPCSA